MKKTFLALAAVIAASPVAFAADQFSVFKICEDKHVIKTSDGQDCGHIEYIVADPAQQRIVTAVVSGGILSDRLVAVPYEEFRYGTGPDITVNVDRQRLVSAPVIERQTLVSGGFIEPTVVQRSLSYFGGGTNVEGRAATSTTVTGAERRNEAVGQTNRNTENINDPNTRANGAAARENQPSATTDASRETTPTRNGSRSNSPNVSEPNTRNSSNATHSTEREPSNASGRSNERTSTPEKNASENPRTTPESAREKASGATKPETKADTKAEEQKSLNQAEEKAARNSKSNETDRDTERATHSARTGTQTSTEANGSESRRDPSASAHEKSSSSRPATPAAETPKTPASAEKSESGEKRL